MKKHIILSFAVLFTAPLLLRAQISEQSKSMSQGTHNALVLDIPNADDSFVGKVWSNYVKDFYNSKSKYDRKINEWSTLQAGIAAIGRGVPVDLYAKIAKKGDGVEVSLWFNLGEEYLSFTNHPDRYVEAEKLLMRFGLEVARESTQNELTAQEKELKKLQGELQKLEKDNENLHKSIESSKTKISTAEKDIIQSEQQEADLKAEILSYEQRIAYATEDKDLERIQEEEKSLKKLKSNLSKLESTRRKNVNAISSSKDRILKAEKDIIENERNQEAKRIQIAGQEKVVEEVRRKLREI
jgi:DNA repair exonuclease SbcCD ATPase subunit